MSAIEFLKQHVPGYSALNPEEQTAITEFTLLWSAMEGLLLKGNANPTSLANKAVEMDRHGGLDIAAYQSPLAYFRARYFVNGTLNHRFDNLRFRANDRQELVEEVLSGKKTDQVSVLTALLLIVYRLRNNLFHGEKWKYGIKDQQSNFEAAADVMKSMLDAPRMV